MFDTLYARVKALAQSGHAQAPLAAVAFAQSGEPLGNAMERNFAAAIGGFVTLVIAGFIVAFKVIRWT
jgi:hypothetical protein